MYIQFLKVFVIRAGALDNSGHPGLGTALPDAAASQAAAVALPRGARAAAARARAVRGHGAGAAHVL